MLCSKAYSFKWRLFLFNIMDHFPKILSIVLVCSQHLLLVSLSVQASSAAIPSMPAGWRNSQKPEDLPPPLSPQTALHPAPMNTNVAVLPETTVEDRMGARKRWKGINREETEDFLGGNVCVCEWVCVRSGAALEISCLHTFQEKTTKLLGKPSATASPLPYIPST